MDKIMHNVENDYLPWMEWINKDKIAYMRLT